MSKPHYIIEYDPHHSAVANLSMSDIPEPQVDTSVYRKTGKRAFDFVFTLLILPVILPLIALFALLIFLRDGASPFYAQDRVGRKGRVFRMWKMRTMVPDAEAKLDAHLAASDEARTEWEVKQKLQDDPRVTAIGRLLRRTSMDELPQFFNVLTGDMSIVGPRPMMAGQEDLYPGRSYYALLPGVTGPWQVSDRNASSFADRAKFDEAYMRDLSIATDCRLVLDTIRVIFRGTGC